MAVIELTVQGMTCDHCVRAVQAGVGAVPGVESVTVDLATGRVAVTAGTEVDAAVLRAAVDEVGYVVVD